jgi:hypothetical protein
MDRLVKTKTGRNNPMFGKYSWNWKGAVALLFLSLCLCPTAKNQTISPIHAEFGKKAVGSFNYTNDTLQPMAVTLESYNFSIDKDGQHLRPLDSTTHIQLSETSARLGPKETHEFAYKLTCDVLPCEVSVLIGGVVGHTQGDKDHPVMQIRLILDHAIYLCLKAKGCRAGIIAASGYKGPQTPSTPTEQTKLANASAQK